MLARAHVDKTLPLSYSLALRRDVGTNSRDRIGLRWAENSRRGKGIKINMFMDVYHHVGIFNRLYDKFTVDHSGFSLKL